MVVLLSMERLSFAVSYVDRNPIKLIARQQGHA
jgi:hypothetical protein